MTPAKHQRPESRNPQLPSASQDRLRYLLGPLQNGVEISVRKHTHHAAFDKVVRTLFTFGRQCMPYRFYQMPMSLEPDTCPVMQGGQIDGIQLASALLQKVGKAGLARCIPAIQPALSAVMQISQTCNHAPCQPLAEVIGE